MWLVMMLALASPHPSPTAGPHKANGRASCWDTALRQAELDECAAKDLAAADQEMNSVYKQLLASTNEQFKTKLRAAQRAWLTFRDAHVVSVYPSQTEWYGSVRPMCHAKIVAELTRERTRQLKMFLDETEGTVCRYPGPSE